MSSYNPIFSKTKNSLNKNTQRFSHVSNNKHKKNYSEMSNNNEFLSLSESYNVFFKAIRPSKTIILNSCQNENFVNDYISKNTCETSGYIGYTGYTGYTTVCESGCESDCFQCSKKTELSEKQFCVYKSILRTEDTLKGIIILVLNFISRKFIFENVKKILKYEEQEDLLRNKIEVHDYIELHEQIKDQINNYIELDVLLTEFYGDFFETEVTINGPNATVNGPNTTVNRRTDYIAEIVNSQKKITFPGENDLNMKKYNTYNNTPLTEDSLPPLTRKTQLPPLTRKTQLPPLTPRKQITESAKDIFNEIIDRSVTKIIQDPSLRNVSDEVLNNQLLQN